LAWREWGNVPVNSSAGLFTNPSTSDLIAEIDSTQLAQVLSGGSLYQVSWLAGASTNAVWQFEQASDTTFSTTAIRESATVLTPANQTGQYILTYKLQKGDRLRARVQSAFTGFASCKISAEPVT